VRIARCIVLLVAAVCCFCAIVPGPALAQDARGSAARSAALAWLALTERGDGAASWGAAGKQFQKAITADKWGEALQKVRPPLGALVERSVQSTQFTKTFPGAPDGDYALLVFRTSFAKKIDSRETVTLEREADGVWRVIGYFIR
jgi:Protein of unknown function (DUF4019)